jgi:hypothetical protein
MANGVVLADRVAAERVGVLNVSTPSDPDGNVLGLLQDQ